MYHDEGSCTSISFRALTTYIPVDIRYYYIKALNCLQPRCTVGLVGSNNAHKRYFVLNSIDNIVGELKNAM